MQSLLVRKWQPELKNGSVQKYTPPGVPYLVLQVAGSNGVGVACTGTRERKSARRREMRCETPMYMSDVGLGVTWRRRLGTTCSCLTR